MKRTLALLLALLLLPAFLQADEGMWLFDIAPKQQIKDKYGFELTDDWLEHVQKSTARFGRGGSASFVSPKGLILTNHHVGLRTIHNLSTPENNIYANGFYAKTFEDEIKCPGVEILVTMLAEDVTAQVNAGIAGGQTPPALAPEEAQRIRNANIARLEREYAERTGLHCEVTSLFHGGVYYMYGYKVYTDIRLVWAPENSIGAFGGDPDNYEFPRYCVDAAFFRAYEDDKPAQIEHYLKWNFDGIEDGELLFVSGFPGRTDRAFTREHLEFQRDVFLPWRLQKMYRREVILSAFASKGIENQRRVDTELTAIQNWRKRAIGQSLGLQTPSLWSDSIPSVEKAGANSPEQKIKDANDAARECSLFFMHDLFELGEAFNSRTFQIARTLVRLAYELEKPNDERLREYRDGNLESLRASLLADTPIHEDVEILKLTDSLLMLAENGERFIGRHAERNERDPMATAREAIRGSKVRDVAERRRLMEGGIAAIEASDDPMIKMALEIDGPSRELRKMYEEEVEAPLAAAYAELAQRRFAELGTNVYPDATFTLRLSYGIVKGYTDSNGDEIAPFTHVSGIFDRAEAQQFRAPFDLSPRWIDARERLDMTVPFNFVTTHDTVGGNSGSPVINTRGEVVGTLFDGNIYALSNNFVYSDERSRSVSAHVAVVIETLRKIDEAQRLLDELGAR
ncbi:MAG: S46 family peptidase [Planctomycetaceae bacterium]|nr:S46 family peptidase [Planctomycetaceae bacterium]